MPAAAPPPAALRGAVLAGAFIGGARRAEAAALAGFLAGGARDLAAWFGAAAAARLCRDPDALRGALDRDIAALDAMIAEQLDAVLHAPRLRRLEGSWRGLRWLLDRVDWEARRPPVRVRLLAASWGEIVRNLERSPDHRQSELFRLIHEDEFGMPGGTPYGLLVVDHEVRHQPAPEAPTDDPTALALLARIAAEAFCPTVFAAAPALLGVDAFADLAAAPAPAAPLANAKDDPNATYERWRRLGQRDDMRFVGVTLPRLLARPPWPEDPMRRDGFGYAEHAPAGSARVCMSAGYALAAAAVRAVALDGWPGDLRGVNTDAEAGGVVTCLPAEWPSTDRRPVWPVAPLDIVFNDAQERSLVEAGLMPLSGLQYTPDAAFVALRSLQAPRRYQGEAGAAATANARISAQFNAMLCASRFAHYLKVIGRDKVGKFQTAGEIQQELRGWLSGYVNTQVGGGAESRAKAPLLAGEIAVRNTPGRPGSFDCTIWLQPHFQLDDVSAMIQLTTVISASGRVA
jgi:type VI secretion system protein ImpD/type VI secretion system protein ImpC